MGFQPLPTSCRTITAVKGSPANLRRFDLRILFDRSNLRTMRRNRSLSVVAIAALVLGCGSCRAGSNDAGEMRTKLHKALLAKGPNYVPRTRHKNADGTPKYTNRLILEQSPYLLQHAHNPVDWFPWG
jgi:Protein of unknown function, DUF255